MLTKSARRGGSELNLYGRKTSASGQKRTFAHTCAKPRHEVARSSYENVVTRQIALLKLDG